MALIRADWPFVRCGACGVRCAVVRTQVCLRWILVLGYPLVTSTVEPEFMREDVETLTTSWEFTEQEMAALESLAVAPDDPVKAMCLFA